MARHLELAVAVDSPPLLSAALEEYLALTLGRLIAHGGAPEEWGCADLDNGETLAVENCLRLLRVHYSGDLPSPAMRAEISALERWVALVNRGHLRRRA